MDVVRMWKDIEYRESAVEGELADTSAHPAGLVTLTGSDLERVVGAGTQTMFTLGCCQPWQTFTTTTTTGTVTTYCLVTTNVC